MRMIVFAALLLAAGPVSCGAAQLPALDVPRMAGVAELIVVGRAVTVDARSADAGYERVTVVIDRVLKGKIRGDVSLRVEPSDPARRSVGERQYGIFFLQGGWAGEPLEVVDPAYPLLPAVPGSGAAAGIGDDVLADIAGLLAEVLRTPPGALTDSATDIADPTAGDPMLLAQEIYSEAAAALQSIGFDKAGAPLLDVAERGENAGRLWAINALLATDDQKLSAGRKANLLAGVRAVLLDPGADVAYSVDMLAASIQAGVDAPAAAPTMAALLSSRRVAVRRAAAHVLRVIGGKEAAVALAQRGLQDDDLEVRYHAVAGLAEATGGEAPALDVFKARETEYLAHWRGWVRSNLR